ncbi:hypothetical protein PLESTF_001531000 [Pleodorina starrii]|nr:hypothetical protein PLESTM_000287300 [Pleodorina starrii]GLC74594.1 hypothetical protein PLESTF_001531000 [Pleodorina starrii]
MQSTGNPDDPGPVFAAAAADDDDDAGPKLRAAEMRDSPSSGRDAVVSALQALGADFATISNIAEALPSDAATLRDYLIPTRSADGSILTPAQAAVAFNNALNDAFFNVTQELMDTILPTGRAGGRRSPPEKGDGKKGGLNQKLEKGGLNQQKQEQQKGGLNQQPKQEQQKGGLNQQQKQEQQKGGLNQQKQELQKGGLNQQKQEQQKGGLNQETPLQQKGGLNQKKLGKADNPGTVNSRSAVGFPGVIIGLGTPVDPGGDLDNQRRRVSEAEKFQEDAKEKNRSQRTLEQACTQYALAELSSEGSDYLNAYCCALVRQSGASLDDIGNVTLGAASVGLAELLGGGIPGGVAIGGDAAAVATNVVGTLADAVSGVVQLANGNGAAQRQGERQRQDDQQCSFLDWLAYSLQGNRLLRQRFVRLTNAVTRLQSRIFSQAMSGANRASSSAARLLNRLNGGEDAAALGDLLDGVNVLLGRP